MLDIQDSAEQYLLSIEVKGDNSKTVCLGRKALESTGDITTAIPNISSDLENKIIIEYGTLFYVPDENEKDSELIQYCKKIGIRIKGEPNEPDLTGFNQDITCYVSWDESGIEQIGNTILEEPPKNWYDYDKKEWANILVKNGELQTYYVWIPKYEYKIESTTSGAETTNVKFIQENQVVADEGYVIPEAFTWKYDETKEKNLGGIWVTKYELSQ